jgi:hypothetical protein
MQPIIRVITVGLTMQRCIWCDFPCFHIMPNLESTEQYMALGRLSQSNVPSIQNLPGLISSSFYSTYLDVQHSYLRRLCRLCPIPGTLIP